MTFLPLAPAILWAILVVVACAAFAYFAWTKRADFDLTTVDWVRRGAILGLTAFMGFGPAIMVSTDENVRVNVDVYFVVDRTGSMAAEDYNGSKPRLEGVKADVMDIADSLTGARFSVLSFDSSASRQLPLTTDSEALRSWADTLTQEITVYSSGSNMNRVFEELSKILNGGREANPHNQQFVYFLTDGENTSDETRQSFEALRPFIAGGAVLGYGTAEGGNMRRYDPLIEDHGYIMDPTAGTGVKAVSTINQEELKALATETGVPYVHRTAPGGLDEVSAVAETALVTTSSTRTTETPQLLLWPFAGALSALLIWEFTGVARRTVKAVG